MSLKEGILKRRIHWEFFAPILALVGLALFAGVFVREASSFRAVLVAHAERDLASRASLAASNLHEPLAQGDFGRIHAAGAVAKSEGLRLTVFTEPGGLYYDSEQPQATLPPMLYASASAGDFLVRLGLPVQRATAPFERAKRGFGLAALSGGAGVLLVFYFTYRQRVRIRELRRLECFRRDFIADLSHEIKTPLTGIVGAVDLLCDADSLPLDGRRRLLDMLKKESVRLNALAQGILSLARIERAEEVGALNPAETDLAELLRECAARIMPAAQVRGTDVAVEVPEHLPFVCDGQLVAQAVDNLLENALRHASASNIRLSAVPEGSGVRIVVADDGIGVPALHAARIFERFYRADASRAADTGGSGLGLAIVRGIARLHAGTVAYRQNNPAGSRFEMTLAPL